MANGEGGGSVPVELIPPPRIRATQAFALAFAAIAALLGFLGFALFAGIAAALSFVFGLVDFLQNRGVVHIPRSALDSEGRVKGFKSQRG